MSHTDVTAMAEEHLGRAREARSGRSAHLVFSGPGKHLTQTVIALCGDQQLAEHQNPGEATVQVLRGRVRLAATSQEAEPLEGRAGSLLPVPAGPHALHALEDSVVLLTVARGLTED